VVIRASAMCSAWLSRSSSFSNMATDFTILAPSAGRVAVSWKRMVARCVIEYS
jgi:hypothetical protein